ncbi:hypothetical protein BD779DRAFT_1673996 [Infundibulicybe gibba]|nr:hypothetical protein BD779DRAFT_1673996 [Infundibulicybe gibba]
MGSFSVHYYGCLDVLWQCTALQECKIVAVSISFSDLARIQALSRSPIVVPPPHSIPFVYASASRVSVASAPDRQIAPRSAAHTPAFLSETIRHLDLSGLRGSGLEVLRTLSGGVIVSRFVTLGLKWICATSEARVAGARPDNGIAVLSDVSIVDLGVGDMDVARLEVLRAAGVRVVFRNRSS